MNKLPDYVIIGTQRGGTTIVQRYLGEHPDIASLTPKEGHFFDNKKDPAKC